MIVSEFNIRLRGLPYSATEEDIKAFLENDNVQIEFSYNSKGYKNGNCIVKFDNFDDKEKSFSKHKSYIGSRYVEGESLQLNIIEM